MKYLKLYENYNELDPFDEEYWNEVEPDGSFLYWLKENHPDESKWDKITEIDCYNKQLTSLKGIENLSKLEFLYCSNNQLTSLKGIEQLTNLRRLYCSNNQLTSLKGIEKLTNLTNLSCNYNQLTSLEEIENLSNLIDLHCFNNLLTNQYKDYLKTLNINELYL